MVAPGRTAAVVRAGVVRAILMTIGSAMRSRARTAIVVAAVRSVLLPLRAVTARLRAAAEAAILRAVTLPARVRAAWVAAVRRATLETAVATPISTPVKPGLRTPVPALRIAAARRAGSAVVGATTAKVARRRAVLAGTGVAIAAPGLPALWAAVRTPVGQVAIGAGWAEFIAAPVGSIASRAAGVVARGRTLMAGVTQVLALTERRAALVAPDGSAVGALRRALVGAAGVVTPRVVAGRAVARSRAVHVVAKGRALATRVVAAVVGAAVGGAVTVAVFAARRPVTVLPGQGLAVGLPLRHRGSAARTQSTADRSPVRHMALRCVARRSGFLLEFERDHVGRFREFGPITRDEGDAADRR